MQGQRYVTIRGVIYNIPCTCGREYIGETGRNLHIRIGEYKYAIQCGNMSNAIAAHAKRWCCDRRRKTLCM